MLSRRDFIKSTGYLSVAFALVPAPSAAQSSTALSPIVQRNPRVDSWLRIEPNGVIRLLTGRVELGQGILTALAQMVAEELDVELSRLTVQAVDTTMSANEGYTFGSASIEFGGKAAKEAAAYLRQLLLQHAASRLDAPVENLAVSDGAIFIGERSTEVSYWSLVEELQSDHVVGAATVKTGDDYSLVGQSVERIDVRGKVLAEESYIQDFRPDGVRHARVIKPPALNARLIEIDQPGLPDSFGDVDIVRDGSFIAVVADNEYRTTTAAAELSKRCQWSSPNSADFPGGPKEWLADDAAEAQLVHEVGEPTRTAANAYSGRYWRPFQAHASLSPSMAIAVWDEKQLTIWSHGQGMYPLRDAIARVVGMPAEGVRCIHMQSSGVYGHNGADDAACDAALIAMRRPGRPIRLQYSRADEFLTEPLGSAMLVNATAETDADGKLISWSSEVHSGPHSNRPSGAPAAGNLESSGLIESGLTRATPRPLGLPRGGADRNAVPYYDIPMQRIHKRFVTNMPVVSSALRGLGANVNIFAIEGLISDVAHAEGIDDIEYRRMHLSDDRALRVLQRLEEMCEKTEADGSRGVAFARYKNSSAYCALAAFASVDEQSGEIRLHKVLATVDAGLVINPDGLLNQIEGGIIQGASWTLKEQVHFDGVTRQARDWASYPILRFSEVPDVEIEIVENTGDPALGVAEASQAPAIAAIANAVAAATGRPQRELPIKTGQTS